MREVLPFAVGGASGADTSVKDSVRLVASDLMAVLPCAGTKLQTMTGGKVGTCTNWTHPLLTLHTHMMYMPSIIQLGLGCAIMQAAGRQHSSAAAADCREQSRQQHVARLQTKPDHDCCICHVQPKTGLDPVR